MSGAPNHNAKFEANRQRTLVALMKAKEEQTVKQQKRKEEEQKEYEKQLEVEKRNPMCDDCEICCEPRAPHRFLTCDDRRTKHKYCEVCVRQHLREEIFERASPWMRCLGDGCFAFYHRIDYERILDQEALEMRSRLETQRELRSVKGMTVCPGCDFAMFVDPGVEIFDCRNPVCMKSFCLNCKERPHLGKSCQEALDSKQRQAATEAATKSGGRRDDLRRRVEEYISEALIRTCVDCKVGFVKENGCNEVHCICGMNVSCYACGEQHIGRDHWFKGTCKHFESTEAREEMERKEAERQAIAKVLRENPGVKEEELKVKDFSENVKKDDERRKARERVLLGGGAWLPGMQVHDADPDTMADMTAQMAGIDFNGVGRGPRAGGRGRRRGLRAGIAEIQAGSSNASGSGARQGRQGRPERRFLIPEQHVSAMHDGTEHTTGSFQPPPGFEWPEPPQHGDFVQYAPGQWARHHRRRGARRV